MKDIRSWSNFPNSACHACVAIGNFDGVHLGHRKVLEQTRVKARELNVPHGILTFEPHPREFFAPSAVSFRLDTAGTKRKRLAETGLEALFELPFNAALATMSTKEFAQRVLCDGFAFSHIFVGANYRFGRNRQGTVSDLITFGDAMGFGVTISDLLTQTKGTISSTRIREALSEGRVGDVTNLLGRHYSIEGPVCLDGQPEHPFGVPTAIITQASLHPPKSGVYAALVNVLEGPHQGRYRATASISQKSLFSTTEVECNTHIHNLNVDLRGTRMSVELIEYLHQTPSSSLQDVSARHRLRPNMLQPLEQFRYHCMTC